MLAEDQVLASNLNRLALYSGAKLIFPSATVQTSRERKKENVVWTAASDVMQPTQRESWPLDWPAMKQQQRPTPDTCIPPPQALPATCTSLAVLKSESMWTQEAKTCQAVVWAVTRQKRPDYKRVRNQEFETWPGPCKLQEIIELNAHKIRINSHVHNSLVEPLSLDGVTPLNWKRLASSSQLVVPFYIVVKQD